MKVLTILILVLVIVCIINLICRRINFNKIIRLFNKNNVSVGGMRGTGKDMLFANYCAYTKVSKCYISNVDYKIKKKKYIPFEPLKLDIHNDYDNFINGNINKYVYPYLDKCPILISDASIYFPSAFESDLKKKYKGIVNFQPLSRHLGDTQLHFNAQNCSQVWDKLRAQSDTYILCMGCKVLFKKIVFMNIRIYEKYDSFISRVPPYKKPKKPLFSKKGVDIDLHKISYSASYGEIKKMKLLFINKSNYNTRFIKGVLENGK